MQADDSIDIFAGPDRGQLNELALVLAAQAIPTAIRWDGQRWLLSVPVESVAVARMELAAYQAESRLESRPTPEATADGRAWPGIYAYASVLLVMALLAPQMRFGIDWLGAGRMDGGRLMAGEWWRAVTALSLHADAAHLLGNIFFGAFFAYSVARYLGGGIGWLAILASGAMGNVLNGFAAGTDHRSIGASTAVFAALGLLSAYLWRRGFRAGATKRERFAPVIAGIGLLAFTGTGGENTDIGAHLFGFIAGFGSGLALARWGALKGQRVQWASAGAALSIFIASWIFAVNVYR